MDKYIVSGLKIIDIRLFVQNLKKLLKLPDYEYVNIVKILDIISVLFSQIGLPFNYIVKIDDDPIFEKNEEAFTDMKTGIIYFKESVIENACRKRYHRSSFTIAHELGHYFLHYLNDNVKLSRVSSDTEVPVYKSPEWQADVFAAEFLMPFDRCKDMAIAEIRREYHITRKAAETRKEKIMKEIKKRSIGDATK